MPISADEVRKIAKLARLRLGEEEVALYQAQFSRILELMSELSELDSAAPAPTPAAPAAPAANVLRDDSPHPFPEPERLLALAPERAGPYYKVKKVLP